MIRNILICTTQVPFTTGGAELHVEGLRGALVEAGYHAEVVSLPFKWYPPAEIMRSALAWRLLDLSESNGKKIDLVIGMKFPAYLARHDSKVLWVMHQYRSAYNLWGTAFDDLSTYPEGTRIRQWIHRCDNQFIGAAKKVFANSKTVARRLRDFNNIDSEPLYHPPPLSGKLNGGDQGDYIFYPSRLEPQKRQELLIEALRHTTTDARIVFAGGSANLQHYADIAKKAGVSDRVCLLGFVDEAKLIDLYSNALAVSYLPFDEDYGYVSLEGMLAAKPLIVTKDGGGAAEFVEDQITGFVVDPEPQALAEAIDQIYTDRNQAGRLGERGREKFVSQNISWPNVVEKIISAAT
ncbi:MAG TPA: glycosyltransferase family 4 protein [Pyrinomonadaceae bacterium]|nr:glycosyltransferase family 4 protein [Pyrinomonadaceae bacterium]